MKYSIDLYCKNSTQCFKKIEEKILPGITEINNFAQIPAAKVFQKGVFFPISNSVCY